MPAGHCATISACRALSVHLAETRRNGTRSDRELTNEADVYFIAEHVAVRHDVRLTAQGQQHLAILHTFTYKPDRFGWLPDDASPSNFADTLERGFAVL